jgi:hypothetical protein
MPDPSLPTQFEILLGQGDGGFLRRATPLNYDADPFGAILVADFNGDKISDVAFGNKVALGTVRVGGRNRSS